MIFDAWLHSKDYDLWKFHVRLQISSHFPLKVNICLQSGISLVPEKQTPFFLKVIPYRFPYDFCPLFTELLSTDFPGLNMYITASESLRDSPV